MQSTKRVALLVISCLTYSQFLLASEQSESKGFIEDSKWNAHARSLYFSRDFKSSHNTGQSKRMAWGLGLSTVFESGFTEGTVGFGLDAWGLQGIRLDGGRGHANAAMDVTPVGDSGRAAHDWSQLGGAVKARISNTTIKYGNQFVSLPILMTDSSRLLPESVTGTLITSKEIENLEINAGHFTAISGAHSTGHDNSGYPSAYYVGMKRLDFIGGTYQFTDNLATSLYYSWNKDIAKRAYGNINYTYPIDNQQSVNVDFNIYHSDYDKKYVRRTSEGDIDKSINNTIWSLAGKYSYDAHSFIVAYQQSMGGWYGHGYDYGSGYGTNDGGSSIWLANSYESDFNAKDEKSLQLSYELSGAGIGIPGLAFKSAYVYGWNADTAAYSGGKRGKERELFNQVSYTIQQGAAKDLAFKVRSSFYRATNRFSYGDNNELRVYVDYPLDLMALIKNNK
ncbi:outer membrane porin, OprD family [Gammaproteobacteria bacterium ESL0073]|nr:outer membrane porin, OprD family [Gammaproteobacteria bacterium ESL0073]